MHPIEATLRKALSVLTVFTLVTSATVFVFPSASNAAGTWNQVVSDSFTRANSSSIGNGWVDAAGIGSIGSNTLVLTAPTGGASTGNVRVLRPTSEASLNQKIDVTSTLADTSSIGHGVVLRGKSVVIGGIDITPAITVTFRHSGSLSFALAYNGYTDFPGSGVTGTASFTPTLGHSYTLSVSILNNFPAVVNAVVTDNTSSTQVANASYNISGEYGSQDLSPYWKTAGVAGLTMEANAGQSVSISNVTTYSYSDSGTFTAPTSPLSTQRDSKTYIATPLPSGGTAPYTIRWYRGGNGFTPPTMSDGSGSGTGTFLGTGQEIIDTSAPTGVSNFSLSYRAVFFDSGANASSGILGPIINLNSPTSKSFAVPVWVGDSITYGYQTSNWANSPAKYANAQISADSSVTSAWAFKFVDTNSYQQMAAPGRTSTDFVSGTNLSGLVSFMADRRVNVASIMLGTNDAKDSVATSAATYKSNIQTLLAAMKAVNPNVRIVLNKPLWFKPDTGYSTDFSTASLSRVAGYSAKLDQLADGTSIVVGDNAAYTEIQTYGWTGTTGVNNAANATTSYPPAPTGGKSYLTDGLHPYDGGAQMVGTTQWGPNLKNALLANYTTVYDVTPPTFSITSATSNNAVTNSAKAGNVVTVVFNASETLSGNPTVTLGSQAMTYASKTGLAYTYTRTLSGTETEGNASIGISGSDVAGNAGTGSGSFTTDFTAPTTPVVSAPSSAVSTTASTATISGTAEANALVKLYTDPNHDGNPADGTLVNSQQLTGGATSFSFSSVPLNSGNNYFVVTALDAVGNVSSSAVVPTISRDNVNPVLSILSPATGASYLTGQSSIIVSGSASDDIGVLSVTSSAAGTITGTTTWSQTVSLGEGANPFTFTAHDAAGNTGAATITITRDSTAPAAPVITTPASLVSTSSSTSTVAGTAEANTLAKLYTDPNHDGNPADGVLVSSQQLTGGSAAFSFAPTLTTGANYFVVTATDAALNVSPAGAAPTITKDTQVPTITISSPSASGTYLTNQTTVAISGSATDNISIASVTSSAAGTVTGASSWSQVVSLSEGTNSITYTSHDTAGNQGTATIVVTRDSVSPSMTGFSITSDNASTSRGKAGNTITAVFTSSEALAANPVVALGTKAMTFASKTGLAYTYTRILDGSESQGSAVLSIQSQDMAGNNGVDTSQTFLTDFTAPTIVITSPAGSTYLTNQSSVAVSGTSSDNTGVTLVTASGTGTVVGTTAWSQAATPLLAGVNTLTYTARDAAGNIASANVVVTRDSVPATLSFFAGASNNAADSTHATTGDAVTVSFTASEALSAHPIVTLGGKNMTFVSVTGNRFTYTRTIDGTEIEGSAIVSVSFSDTAGNAAVDTSQTFPLSFVMITPSPSPSAAPSATPTPTSTALTATIGDASTQNGDLQAPSRPTFSGTAPAGSQVTVTVHSDPVSCSATANSSGNWSCTLASDLPQGRHSVDVTAITPSGQSVSLASFPMDVAPTLAKTGNATKNLSLLGLALLLAAGGELTRRRLIKGNAR